MNPEEQFCPNIDCPARGQRGEGNITIHSQKEKRCHCNVCNTTFAVSKGTLFYRLRTDPQIVMWVIVLLAYGCPLQAIVKAFGFDERSVRKCIVMKKIKFIYMFNNLIDLSMIAQSLAEKRQMVVRLK